MSTQEEPSEDVRKKTKKGTQSDREKEARQWVKNNEGKCQQSIDTATWLLPRKHAYDPTYLKSTATNLYTRITNMRSALDEIRNEMQKRGIGGQPIKDIKRRRDRLAESLSVVDELYQAAEVQEKEQELQRQRDQERQKRQLEQESSQQQQLA